MNSDTAIFQEDAMADESFPLGHAALFIMIILTVIMSACSTPLPFSETVMFHNAKNSTSDKPKNKIAMTAVSNGQGSVIRRYMRNHSKALRDKDIADPNRTAGGITINTTNNQEGTLSVALGYKILGANATFPFAGRNYLTLNLGAFSGAEAIWQRPLLDRRFNKFGLGLAGGLYARYDLFFYENETQIKSVGFASYGLRSVVQVSGVPDGLLHGFFSVGYAPRLNHSIMFLGVAVRLI